MNVDNDSTSGVLGGVIPIPPTSPLTAFTQYPDISVAR